MTKSAYLSMCEKELVGLTIKEAEAQGFKVATEIPERITARAVVIVEIKDEKIREVIEIV